MQRNNLFTLIGLATLLTIVAFMAGQWSGAPATADDRESFAEFVDEDADGGEFEDEDFESEEEFEEMERHQFHLELEMAELEATSSRLDLVGRLSEVADDELLSAAFAVRKVAEIMEPGEAVDFLNDTLDAAKNASVRRLIRIKLAELYAHTEQRDQATKQLRALIVGE